MEGVNIDNLLPSFYTKTSEHNSWRAMKSRCYYKKYRCYDRYGGRGIKVCDRWLIRGKNQGFINFIKDMGWKPHKGYWIERIDNDGDYCPENCRWASPREQNNNTSANSFHTINGETKTISEWCREYNIGIWTIYNRMRNNKFDFEKALKIPVSRTNTFKPSKYPMRYCKNCGIEIGRKQHRIVCGNSCRNKTRAKNFTPHVNYTP